MADWRFYQEQNERREKIVRDLQDGFRASNQRSVEAYHRKKVAHNAKTIPNYPTIAWGSLGLGGCIAFLLGIVVLGVVSFALCCGMIRLTSHGKSVPTHTTPKHQSHRHHGTSLHSSSCR